MLSLSLYLEKKWIALYISHNMLKFISKLPQCGSLEKPVFNELKVLGHHIYSRLPNSRGQASLRVFLPARADLREVCLQKNRM